MDIKAGIQAAIAIAALGAALSIWIGLNEIRTARGLNFYRLRDRHMKRGWRLLFSGLGLSALFIVLIRFGEPVAFKYFPPTPTVSLTPTTWA